MEETGYTLITGSTGLIGQILLRDLMRARLPVAVLVRPARDLQGRQRIDRQLHWAEHLLQRQFPRPVILQGDLTKPDLGLSIAEQRWVQNHCRRVLHCAACVSFRPAETHSNNEPFRTNVAGTRHLAEFCLARGIREFHHISSAYVCGVREGIILETDGAAGQLFSNDYEASKSRAEEDLKSLPGLDSLTIYRPSIVIDPSRLSSGLGDRTVYLVFSLLQLLSRQGELPPPEKLLQALGLSGVERKNIVPATWVSRMIVQILRRPDLHGSTYHLTQEQGTTVLDLLTAFWDVLSPAGDSPLQQPLVLQDLGGLGTVVEQFVETFTPYFRDDPTFDRAQLRHALHVCTEADCPEVNHTLLQDLARQQLLLHTERGTEKDHVRPASRIHESEAESRWQSLQKMFPADVDAVSAPVECIGLTLSGSGGGDWQLILSETGTLSIRSGGAANSNRSIYASARTWNQLIHGSLQLSKACVEGRVLFENAVSGVEESSLQEILQQVLSILVTSRVTSRDCDINLESPEQQRSPLSDSAISSTSSTPFIHPDHTLLQVDSAVARNVHVGNQSGSHFDPEGESPC